jgi:hypothetical protein
LSGKLTVSVWELPLVICFDVSYVSTNEIVVPVGLLLAVIVFFAVIAAVKLPVSPLATLFGSVLKGRIEAAQPPMTSAPAVKTSNSFLFMSVSP